MNQLTRKARAEGRAEPAMTFADQLQPHVKRLGTLRAAALCGVTPRSLQLWIRGQGNPNLATQAGALAILRKAKK